MAEAVYILCVLTSAAVAALLIRGYMRTRSRLLLWSGLGFIGLCLNNVVLVADVVIVPSVDLSMYRTAPALAGMCILLFGLIWDAE
jgi:hypothetical protein